MRQNASRIPVPGKKPVEIDLGDQNPDDYSVGQKKIGSDVPTKSRDGITIEWFNAFGIRKKNKDGTLGDYADIAYTVVMDAIPSGKRLFAFYRGEVHEFTLQTGTAQLMDLYYRTEGDKTYAALSVGDPPLGYGP